MAEPGALTAVKVPEIHEGSRFETLEEFHRAVELYCKVVKRVVYLKHGNANGTVYHCGATKHGERSAISVNFFEYFRYF